MIHEMAQYNCSHTINQFSFGELFPGVVNPLDGTSQIIPRGQGSAHMQYFIKVVPTVYESTFGSVDTNQFSVTQHTQPITMQDAFSGGGGGKIPGGQPHSLSTIRKRTIGIGVRSAIQLCLLSFIHLALSSSSFQSFLYMI